MLGNYPYTAYSGAGSSPLGQVRLENYDQNDCSQQVGNSLSFSCFFLFFILLGKQDSRPTEDSNLCLLVPGSRRRVCRSGARAFSW